VFIRRNHNVFSPKSGQAPVSEPLEEGQVLSRLEAHFDRWDANQNGQIAWSEVRQRIADPECEKDEAVALATLYGLVNYDADWRGLERKSPVGYSRLYDLYYDYADDDDKPIADSLYQKYEAKLRNSTDELFPNILPNGFMGKQGTGPSCGFLAATFSQLIKNPSAVKNAIHQKDDGQIEVQFPGLENGISIHPVTDTEQALFASAGSNGNWLATLEKAWGTHRADGDELRAFEMDTYPQDAIEAWTGGEATTARIPKNPKPTKEGELPDYLRTTSRELAANHVVVAWTRFDGLTQGGLVPGHAYTLNGVDHEDGTVSLRNPWGRMEPQGKDGRALDGHDDGVFEFPLEEFHKNFGQIARQTD
jgi:hypothetical protein